MPEQISRPRVTNDQLCKDVEEVKDMVKELQRTIRGFNGVVGLATKFETLETKLMLEIKGINEKLQDLAEKAEERGKAQAVATDKAAIIAADAANVKWPYLLDKFFAPIITAIIIGLIFMLIK